MRASTVYAFPRESATDAIVCVALPFAPVRSTLSPAGTPPAGTVSTSWLSVLFVTELEAIVRTNRGPVAPPAPTTTPVTADDAAAAPAVFEAVTTTRSVDPTSAVVSPYVVPVTTFAQPLPE